jgi:hypothetical protein
LSRRAVTIHHYLLKLQFGVSKMNTHIHEIYLHTAVKIHKPENLNNLTPKMSTDYVFDREDRFTDYIDNQPGIAKLSYITKDDKDQYYYITGFKVCSLDELKLSRQIFVPSYLDKDDHSFPLIDRLKKENLIPIQNGFDKAYAHVSVYTKKMNLLTAIDYSRLANVDGYDDPLVIDRVNYISNYYENQETRYVSGAETNSFATISENRNYFYTIHLPNVSTLYLKYFVYFVEYQSIPSHQMMPRLLGNLWGSMIANNHNFNSYLFKSMMIGDLK